ncbi:MAG TPA: cytochrome c oxidase assembly protein [Solirubrobacterales bacterium]|nr:cytochrome c oxidase assembly protein [Solirubrobacterales bacterium]
MTPRRGLFLLAGWLAFGVAISPPLDAAADRELAMHMLQHALLLAVAAPLLALGEPVRVALAMLPPRGARRLARALRSGPARLLLGPLGALALFAALLFVTHVPAVYDACLENEILHGLEHFAYLGVGVLLWTAIVGADPTARPLSLVTVSGLIVAAMVPMMAIGVALATASHVVYSAYLAHASQSAVLAEQETAATAMWAGDLPFALALVLAGWAALQREERAQRRRESAVVVLSSAMPKKGQPHSGWPKKRQPHGRGRA